MLDKFNWVNANFASTCSDLTWTPFQRHAVHDVSQLTHITHHLHLGLFFSLFIHSLPSPLYSVAADPSCTLPSFPLLLFPLVNLQPSPTALVASPRSPLPALPGLSAASSKQPSSIPLSPASSVHLLILPPNSLAGSECSVSLLPPLKTSCSLQVPTAELGVASCANFYGREDVLCAR